MAYTSSLLAPEPYLKNGFDVSPASCAAVGFEIAALKAKLKLQEDCKVASNYIAPVK